MFCRLNNTVGPFGVNRRFSPVRQSEAIFVELMGPNITHLERFVRGVVEHPKSGSCVEGIPGDRPRCGFHVVFHVPIRDIRAGRDL